MGCLSRFKEVDLRNWFDIPYEVAKIKWEANSNGVLANFSLPDILFQNPVLFAKLKSFAYVRADFELSFKINGTKMQYGKLMVVPFPNSFGLIYLNGAVRPKHTSLWSASNMPHVLLSPSEQATQELKIPFYTPRFWWNMNQLSQGLQYDTYESARVMFYVLNPLTSVSDITNPVTITVFCRLIKPEFSALTAEITNYTPPVLPDFDDTFESTVLLGAIEQSNFDEQVGPVAEMVGKATKGVVTGVTKATGLAKTVVSDMAGPINLISAFGGKPDDVSALNRMQIGYSALAHTDGLDTSRPMSMDPACSVKYLDWAASSLDVHSIPALTSMYSLIDQVTITQLSADVGSWTVNPIISRISATPQVSTTNWYHSNLSYWTSLFAFWTGSITFKFQFVASQFHSLRVRFYWSPFGTQLPSNSASAVYNQVIDITKNTEFEITIPYYGTRPQLQRGAGNGTIFMQVVTELTSGLSSMTSIAPITCNIWVKGGEDFRLYRPDSKYASITPPLVNIPSAKKLVVKYANYDPLEKSKRTTSEVFIAAPACKSMHFDGFTMGEEIHTTKQLARRFSELGKLEAPFHFTYNWTAPVRTLGITPDLPSWFRVVSQFYRFGRGSMRIKLLPQGASHSGHDHDIFWFVNTIRAFSALFPIISPAVITPDIVYADGVIVCPGIDKCLPEVTIPYYTNALMFPLQDDAIVQFDEPLTTAPAVEVRVIYSSDTLSLLESVGDDFQFLVPLGAPALLMGQILSSTLRVIRHTDPPKHSSEKYINVKD